MNPYSVNPYRDDEFLVAKRDRKGNVVHYRRRRHQRSEKDDNRFFLATGIAMVALFGWMLADWAGTPM